MTLTQLRYFVAIVDAGLNITLAAERVHATQPGLSRQIKHLEDELGVKLFNRGQRSLDALTPAGREVLARARRILAEADSIRAFAANERGAIDGRLTVLTTHTQARYVLPEALAAIKRDWPLLSVQIESVGDEEIGGRLERGIADLALVSSATHPPTGGLVVPLFRWRRVLLIRRDDSRFAVGLPPRMTDLARHPLVTYESALRPESSLRRAFSAFGLEPDIAVTARDADLIKTYVRVGLGIGIVAEMAVDPDDPELIVLPAPPEIPECTAYGVLPEQRVARDYTLALLRAIAPHLDRHDLRRAASGAAQPRWPEPPPWSARL
ncbi:MAG: LysR family transcriptional regulator [Lysobacterales bacterium]|jgi:DNA-binding transcriptional LysR family regulator|nr:MAG: LysR family transcriptional regulator [Xanthomonadales bacterium]